MFIINNFLIKNIAKTSFFVNTEYLQPHPFK